MERSFGFGRRLIASEERYPVSPAIIQQVTSLFASVKREMHVTDAGGVSTVHGRSFGAAIVVVRFRLSRTARLQVEKNRSAFIRSFCNGVALSATRILRHGTATIGGQRTNEIEIMQGSGSVELVADDDGAIVGAIDVECEEEPNTVCSSCAVDEPESLGGMIWHLAVHPDFQRRGIGGLLLAEARRRAQERGVRCFEAYTRDDPATIGWYESHGFRWVKSYLHVYIEGRDEVDRAVQSSIPRLRPVQIFAHYTGDDREAVRARFHRVHDCNLYRLSF